MNIILSQRLKNVMNPAFVKKALKNTLKDTAEFHLGRSTRNKIGPASPPRGKDLRQPFTKAFGKWTTRSNVRTRSFAPYKTPGYEEFKRDVGELNFLHLSGDLFEDAIKHARVTVRGSIATIRPAGRNKSKKYAGVHHNGSDVMPKRRFYQVDELDKTRIRKHIRLSLGNFLQQG